MFQPVQCDVEEQRTDPTPLWSSLLGRRKSLSPLEHPGGEPRLDHVPGRERPESVQQPVVIDLVERRGQIGVQRPHPLGPRAFAGVVDRADRVVAATSRTEPVGAGFEPGLPLRFQRGADPALVAAVRDHRNPERPQLRTVTRLGYVHPLDRTRSPRPSLAVHPHRQLRPGHGGQCELPVDPGRLAASVALRRLPHAQQRVAPAPQHQFLQVPERAQVPVPRRREDPLTQPPYVVLVEPPVDGVPAQGVVRRSVHHEVSNLPSDTGGYVPHSLHSSPAHVSAPFETRHSWPGIRPVTQQQPLGGAATIVVVSCRLSPTGIRFLSILFPPGGFRHSLRLAYRAAAAARTLSGFPRSARVRNDRGGCLLYSGAAVSSQPS